MSTQQSATDAGKAANTSGNPFFEETWDTPYGAPPFERVTLEHFAPALDEGMRRQSRAIEQIAQSEEKVTFSNTIELLERSGQLLDRTGAVFFNIVATDATPELQAIRAEYAPKLSEHSDSLYTNAALFQRLKTLKEHGEEAALSTEQEQLLQKYYRRFVRAGAELNDDNKARLMAINSRLAKLYTDFGDRLLAETDAYELYLKDEKDLAGLPGEVIETAAQEAKTKGHSSGWSFTLVRSSITPFLQYADDRGLREKIYRAYVSRGAHSDDNDTRDVLKEIVVLRAERAELLGFASHAHYMIDNNMAKTPNAVFELLNKLWAGAVKKAEGERSELTALMQKEQGKDAKLEPWDWWYFAEKVRKAKYDLSTDDLKPYFRMSNVRQGAFDTATKLFGISFEDVTDRVPRYHPDVEAFDVKDAEGGHVGLLYVDYHPRSGKRGGAWMSEFRTQSKLEGARPIVVNVGNFPAPAGNKPALLGWDEVRTLFHEFGHALHGLISNVTYESLAGTNVKRDYVEFPSQLLENWAREPSVIKQYAKHYETNEPIPDALLQKLEASGTFNQGFGTTELVAAALLDLRWHTLSLKEARGVESVEAFESAVLKEMGALHEVPPRYHSSYFQHIFSSDGYSAGYYVYLWAQVLEADAFAAFEESGDVFDSTLAGRLKEYIFAGGSSNEEMQLYTSFRGRMPHVEPLLEKRGLNVAQ